MTLMIYGAYGYTGQLVSRAAVERGIRPILAGRDPVRLEKLAAELDIEHRAFDLRDARGSIEGVRVVLNCAGPFAQTAVPLAHACIDKGAHYLDITGEIPVFQYCHELNDLARKAGVVLCPGVGFDVVPTDCLAASLARAMSDAVSLDLAFSFGTRPSEGTAKTAIAGLKHGGMIRRDHALTRVPDGYHLRRIPFAQGKRWAASVPFGDVFTAWVSTTIPNITMYADTPLAAGLAMKLANPFRPLLASDRVQAGLVKFAERRFSGGPDERERDTQRTEFWGEAKNAAGQCVSMGFTGPNVYALTVETALAVASYCLNRVVPGGYYTPSMLMGPDFIAAIPGVSEMLKQPSGAGKPDDCAQPSQDRALV